MSDSTRKTPVKELKSNNLKETKISDTIIVATLPFIAYSIVFAYQWGYLSVFKIPLEFIFFDLTGVFLILTSILLISGIAYILASPFLLLFSKQPKPIRIRLYGVFAYIVFFLIYLILYFRSPTIFKDVWTLAGITIVFSITPFLIPLITQRSKKGGYLAKLKAQDEWEKKKPSPFFDTLVGVVGIKIFIALSISVMAIFIAHEAGHASALQQSEFWVVNTSPERIAIWFMNDRVVAVLFDRNKEEIEPNFVILDLGASFEVEYHLEKTGPLIVKK